MAPASLAGCTWASQVQARRHDVQQHTWPSKHVVHGWVLPTCLIASNHSNISDLPVDDSWWSNCATDSVHIRDVSSGTSSCPRGSSRTDAVPLALEAWPWLWKSSITTFSFALSYCPLFGWGKEFQLTWFWPSAMNIWHKQGGILLAWPCTTFTTLWSTLSLWPACRCEIQLPDNLRDPAVSTDSFRRSLKTLLFGN